MLIRNVISAVSTVTAMDIGVGILFVVLLVLYIMRRRSRRAKS